jgi:hypothetical protein
MDQNLVLTTDIKITLPSLTLQHTVNTLHSSERLSHPYIPQDMTSMWWLTDFQTHGSGLPPDVSAAMSASVYFNRLQDWENFKLVTAI